MMAYDLFPAVDENYDFPPEVRAALAKAMELRNTVVPMTQTARNNLTAPEKWDGRLIINLTTDRIERYDEASATWKPITESSELSDAITTERSIRGGLRNVLRNGDFSISQRSDGPFTTPSWGAYCIDGWKHTNVGTGATMSTTREANYYESRLSGLRSRNHFKSIITGGTDVGAQSVLMAQPIEGIPFRSGETITLSFTADVSAPVTVFAELIIDTTGTLTTTIPPLTPIQLTPGAKRYEVQLTMPTYSGLGNQGTDSLRFSLWAYAGANVATGPRSPMAGMARPVGVTYSVGEIQLESGSIATQFERLSKAVQLEWAQRYFWTIHDSGLRIPLAYNSFYSVGWVYLPFPVEMRKVPTVTMGNWNVWTPGGSGPGGAITPSAAKITKHSVTAELPGAHGAGAAAADINLDVSAEL